MCKKTRRFIFLKLRQSLTSLSQSQRRKFALSIAPRISGYAFLIPRK